MPCVRLQSAPLARWIGAGAMAIAALGCSGGHRDGANGRGAQLSVKGSDTMVVLAQRWAEGYMATHPEVTVRVSGGGSGTGLAALVHATTDIATSSRPINDREAHELETGRHVAPVETAVALDALAIYVHAENPIERISIPELRAIFSGEIDDWSELGAAPHPIVLYSRENSSGTYAYFKEHVLDGGDFAASAQTLPGTAAVIHAVSHDRFGIGYGGIGYAVGVRTVPVAATRDGEAVTPSLANATSGRYPISRQLFLYTAGDGSPTASAFVHWVLTPEGQELIERAGFFPLPTALAVQTNTDPRR